MRRSLILVLPLVAVLIAAAAFLLQPSAVGLRGGSQKKGETSVSVSSPGGKSGESSAANTGTGGEALPDAELAQLYRQIVELPPGLDRRQKLERFAFEKAKKDPEAALRELASLKGQDRASFLRGMFEQFSTLPHAEALGWAKKLEASSADRTAALTTLVDTWRAGSTPVDPTEAARRAARFGADVALGFQFIDGENPDPQMAAMWAQEFATGREKADLLGGAGALLAKTDLNAAVALGKDLAPADRGMFLRRLATGVVAQGGETAWNWANQLEDPADRAAAQGGVLRELGRTDPAGAMAKAMQMTPGDDRTRAGASIAWNWASTDPDSATAWAEGLTDPDQKKAATALVQRVASNGIGVAMHIGADGYPMVANVLPGTPAGQNGQIQTNDRIIGIAPSGTAFTDTKGMTLTQIANLVKAQGNGNVQLQVVSATDNSTKTVELPRAQGFRGGFGGGRFRGQ